MADGFGFRHAFGPGDITTVAILPDAVFVLDEVSDFSISTHFDKEPIRQLGHALPQAWATGAGTIAGTLVCKQMTHAALWKVRRFAGTIRYSSEEGGLGSRQDQEVLGENWTITQSQVNQMAASILPQQLPPFHLMFVHQSQSGQMGLARLYDITFTDYSEVKGTTNSQTEETLQYQAQFYEQLRLRKSLTPKQMQEMAGQTLKNDNGAMWNDPRKPQMVDELMSLESVDSFQDYLLESTQDRVEATEDPDRASAQNIADTGTVVITNTFERNNSINPQSLSPPENIVVDDGGDVSDGLLKESKILSSQEIDVEYVTEDPNSSTGETSLTTETFHGWIAHRRVNQVDGSLRDELRVTGDGTTEEPDDWSSTRKISESYTEGGERDFRLGGADWIHKEIYMNFSEHTDISVRDGEVKLWLEPVEFNVKAASLPAPGTYRKNHDLFPEEMSVSIDRSDGIPTPDSTLSDRYPAGGPAVKTASSVSYDPFEIGSAGQITFDGSQLRVGYEKDDPGVMTGAHATFPYLGFAPQSDSFRIEPVAPFGYSPSTPLIIDGTVDVTTDPNTFSIALVNRGESVARQGIEADSYRAGFSDAMQFKFPEYQLVVQAVIEKNEAGNLLFETVRVVAIPDRERLLPYQGSSSVQTLVWSSAATRDNYYIYDGNGNVSEGKFQAPLPEWVSVSPESSLPSVGNSLTVPPGMSLQFPDHAGKDNANWGLHASNPVDISV
jgi:hypothetical protein